MITEKDICQKERDISNIKNQKEITYEEAVEMFNSVLDAMICMWEEIKSVYSSIYQTMSALNESLNTKGQQRRNWYIPRNTMKSHQVLDKRPRFSQIRNYI